MLIGWIVAQAVAQEPPAPDVPWWVGLPVAQVNFASPEGGLPDESLDALLRVEQGEPLDPHEIAQDLATLFQVNEFSAVEASVAPWVIEDPDGNPRPAVELTYVVYPAPRIAHTEVSGDKRFRARALLGQTGLTRGQVFYPETDADPVAARIERYMASRGWTDARVQVRTTEPEPGLIYVAINVVDEGEPNRVERLTFTGDIEGVASERQLRRWARRAGVAEGRPLAADAILEAQQQIHERLGAMRGGWFRRRTAWIEARVTPLAIRSADGEGGTRITFAIEPGLRLELEVNGLDARTVEQALGIDHRLRLTRGFVEQADERLEEALQERGWLHAEATVREPREYPEQRLQVLEVDVVRGERDLIGDIPDLPNVDYDFQLTDVPEPAERAREARELQAVFEQASPDVLRRDFYTVREMEVGLAAAEQYYVDRGYLDAELELLEPRFRTRATLANAWRMVVGAPRSQQLTPVVSITRGPSTVLSALEVRGAAPGVALEWLPEARAARVGQPFSPQQIEVLARRVLEEHRAQGYLEADVRVQHTESDEHQRSSVIAVEPGAQILLRSVLVRGTRFTRPWFVQNEIDLALGQPVTSEALDEIRTDLYELSIFRSVDLQLLGDEDARDLIVTLDERARTAFEIGPGLSTDQGIRTSLRFTRYNLFGLGQRFDAVGQIGLAFRSSEVTDWVPDVNNPEWRGALSYTAPRFPFRGTELVTDVLLRERRQERTWQMDRTGGGVALQAELGRTQLRAGARVESRQLREVDRGVMLEGDPWTSLVVQQDTLAVPSTWRWQESLTALALYDRRDDTLAPRSGYLVSVDGEWVPGLPWDQLVRGQQPAKFVKTNARLALYQPIGEFTLHGSAGGGYIHSFAGVPPLEDRYRLGGTGSFRGFVRDGVGPRNVAPNLQVDWPAGIGPVIDYALRDEPSRWTPTGGDVSATGTLELLAPLPAFGLTAWEGYAAEVFSDFGNVWLRSTDSDAAEVDAPLLRYSVGLGLRVTTPIGPLQVDGAWNPAVTLGSPERKALLVDEWQEPAFRAHLALGALF
ncbi:MAG: BamA/TamA family outer membrane protein [Myxococcota bacterium]